MLIRGAFIAVYTAEFRLLLTVMIVKLSNSWKETNTYGCISKLKDADSYFVRASLESERERGRKREKQRERKKERETERERKRERKRDGKRA